MKPRLIRWIAVLKANLFGSIPNAVFTLLLVWGLAVVTIGFLDWAVFNAVWRGESRDVAVVGGATWAYIAAKIRFYLYGFYPPDQIWRINLYCLLILASLAPLMLRIKAKIWIFMS